MNDIDYDTDTKLKTFFHNESLFYFSICQREVFYP